MCLLVNADIPGEMYFLSTCIFAPYCIGTAFAGACCGLMGFGWYVRAVEPTMAATLSSIASQQSTATENLEREVKHFLDYCATHPNAGVRFHASDKILAIHSVQIFCGC